MYLPLSPGSSFITNELTSHVFLCALTGPYSKLTGTVRSVQLKRPLAALGYTVIVIAKCENIAKKSPEQNPCPVSVHIEYLKQWRTRVWNWETALA